MKSVVAGMLAAAGSLAILAMVIAAFVDSPGEAFAIFVRGAIGSSYAVGETLLKSVPLLLTAVSVAVAFRAGVWNIGAEGQFVCGGIAALVIARTLPAGTLGAVAALAAAALGGAAWAGVAAWLKIRRNAPEVLTTILMNFVAIHLLGYLVNGPLREGAGRYPQSDAVPLETILPLIGAGRLHAGAFIALGIAFAVYWILFHTAAGLRMRAGGLNPRAAQFAGISVRREIARAMLLSGGIAGIAGGIELLGVTTRLYERFASGYGYAGIAVALLGQLHPLAAIASAVLFGALTTGSGELQRATGVSAAIATLAQGIVVLVILVVTSPWLSRRIGSLRLRSVLPGREASRVE